MDKPLVVIATYNEIENLPALIEGVFQHAPQCDVLVVDDNSPDGTGTWCDKHAAMEPRLSCLHREGKLGLGTAIIAGLRYGIERGYQYVLTMDADLSHAPLHIPHLLDGMEPPGAQPIDVMIGSRYAPGGGIEGWPLTRHFMSRAVNLYARCLLTLSPKDCSGGFRCYRASKLAELDFDSFRSYGYAFLEEILWRLKRLGARFGESPITFVDRQRGQSKINSMEAREAMRVIFGLGLRNWTGRQ